MSSPRGGSGARGAGHGSRRHAGWPASPAGCRLGFRWVRAGQARQVRCVGSPCPGAVSSGWQRCAWLALWSSPRWTDGRRAAVQPCHFSRRA
eukprot:8051803-Alexandrium_andersonii.AAC.1